MVSGTRTWAQLHLVATFVDDLQDVSGQSVLLPVPDGVRDLSSLGGDAVILSEDSPVSVRHLVQLLLGPVPVVPALLGFLLPHLLQSCPAEKHWSNQQVLLTNKNYVFFSRRQPASLLLLLLLQRASLLHQIAVETRLLAFLLLQVDAGDEAAAVQLHLMLLFVSATKD